MTEEEEKQFQIDRANFAAKSALSRSQMRKGSGGRGGRGSRGGRGGRGGGRQRDGDREKAKGKGKDAPPPIAPSESQAGEKRKRAIEPDGAPDAGIRGEGVPAIVASKKAKADES